MTQEEIISLLQQANFTVLFDSKFNNENYNSVFGSFPAIDKFVKLIIKQEREKYIEAIRTVGGEFAVECENLINAKEFN